MTAIARHYVRVENRLVHLRRAGQGAPILLLHQSPRSSAELIPLIERLAERFDVIAPDTPGNGLSDPLDDPAAPIEAFGDAVALLLDQLGIGRCGLYGFHTGAAIGAAFAARHGERVAFHLLNGLPAFDATEQADLAAHYLPPFVPRWDGGHLAWLWARLREQTIHFPWYRTDHAARMPFDVPPPEALMEAVRDFLQAGDAYRVAYGAAFAADGARLATGLPKGGMIVSTARDPLRPHLDRLRAALPDGDIREIPSGLDPVCALIAELSVAAGEIAPATPADNVGNTIRRIVRGGDIAIHARLCGVQNDAPPLVLLHEIGSSGAVLVDAIATAGNASRPIWCLDLPGCGDSDMMTVDQATSLDSLGDIVSLAIGALGIAQWCEVAGMGAGARIAALIGHSVPAPPLITSGGTYHSADIATRLKQEVEVFGQLDTAGGHLLRAWHRVRDGHLFDPWHDRRADAAFQGRPNDHAFLQEECKALILGWNAAPDLWRLCYSEAFSK